MLQRHTPLSPSSHLKQLVLANRRYTCSTFSSAPPRACRKGEKRASGNNINTTSTSINIVLSAARLRLGCLVYPRTYSTLDASEQPLAQPPPPPTPLPASSGPSEPVGLLEEIASAQTCDTPVSPKTLRWRRWNKKKRTKRRCLRALAELESLGFSVSLSQSPSHSESVADAGENVRVDTSPGHLGHADEGLLRSLLGLDTIQDQRRALSAVTELEKQGLSVSLSQSRSAADSDTDNASADESAERSLPVDEVLSRIASLLSKAQNPAVPGLQSRGTADADTDTDKNTYTDASLERSRSADGGIWRSSSPRTIQMMQRLSFLNEQKKQDPISVSQFRSTGQSTRVNTYARTHTGHQSPAAKETRSPSPLSSLESLADLRPTLMKLLYLTEEALSDRSALPAAPFHLPVSPGSFSPPELDPSAPFYSARDFRKSNHAFLPTYSFSRLPRAVRLVYLRTHERANAELTSLFFSGVRNQAVRVVGFDTEWRSSKHLDRPERPVALVQLAADNTILLLQLSAMKMFPSRLIDVLDDETIIKVGVSILGDAQRLYRDFAVTMRSCVELSYLARCVDRDRWSGDLMELISLPRLVHAYKGHSLQKGKVRMSDWEAELTDEQQRYAANDAHAGMTVGTELLARAHHLDRSLFMFDVVRANAVRVDGQSWHVRDRPPPPPPARKIAAPLKKIPLNARPVVEEGDSKFFMELKKFINGESTTADADSSAKANANTKRSMRTPLDRGSVMRETTPDQGRRVTTPPPFGSGRHAGSATRTADPWVSLPKLLSGFQTYRRTVSDPKLSEDEDE